MLRARASYRVLGRPALKRPWVLDTKDRSTPSEGWFVDGAEHVVAAVLCEGELWMAGDSVFADTQPSVLASGPQGAPSEVRWDEHTLQSVTRPSERRWAKHKARPGRYVAIAGAARSPAEGIIDREALREHLLATPAEPAPGRLARLFGKRTAPVEAAALIIDLEEQAAPDSLPAWLQDLSARTFDLTWKGNEGGQGLVQTFRRPLAGTSDVRTALLDHAREDATLAQLIREQAAAWLEDCDGDAPVARRLVPDDPARGWVEDLELDTIATNISGATGAWLDAGTPHARLVWRSELPGSEILSVVRTLVEQPAIVAVHSQPEDSVVALHLIGGIDRSSGDLVGFVLSRVWT
jgi:hypothetical protein